MAIYKPGREAQEISNLLTPSSLQNCEEIDFYCLSHQVCGTSLWQCWKISTLHDP